ncbi:MAG: trypsin-like peptidase domain-containing protein [Anaerolineae bacterium]|nr:trypsin-like peptidase domain-containing protein [Anaerolineae bacterium]
MLVGIKNRAALAITALLLVVFGFMSGTLVMRSTAAPLTAQDQPRNPITDEEKYFSQIFNQVSPSVVSISITGESDTMGEFGASGTGFVIDTDGHIVTNNHVVDNATQIEVNFLNGTIAEGTVVGLDPDSDLAVLKVDLPAEQLTPVTFGDSYSLFIGETTLAIGSPFGQRWTLTSGIVSALDRTIQGLDQYTVGSAIQTDAAINPGNSGGPLLNLDGQVIGVNAQIAPGSNGANAGIGFAIPSNLVKRVAEQLIRDGKVSYSYLGIASGPDISLDLIKALNLPNNIRGVVVADVTAGSPAEQAGLQAPGGLERVNSLVVPSSADIITAIDGQPVTNMSSLVSYLASNTVPGQTVNLSIYRDGQQIDLPVTLSERPAAP